MKDRRFGLARNKRGAAGCACYGCYEGSVAGCLASFLGDALVGVGGNPEDVGVCEGVGGFCEVFPTHLRVEALDEGYGAFCFGTYGFQTCVTHAVGECFGTGDEYFGACGYVLCEQRGACLCGADDSFCSGVHAQFTQVLCYGFYGARCVVGDEDDRYVEFFFGAVERFGRTFDGEGTRVDYAVQIGEEGIVAG